MHYRGRVQSLQLRVRGCRPSCSALLHSYVLVRLDRGETWNLRPCTLDRSATSSSQVVALAGR